MTGRRLVAVLGYSSPRRAALHPVCAARLERAAREARADDAILLSGWARRRGRSTEADLMAQAWNGSRATVLVDRTARSTFGNVVGAAAAARSLGVEEIVLVTSSWHGRRAGVLLRAAVRGSGRRVTIAATDEPGALRARFRELACWAAVPFQAALAVRDR